MMRLVNSNANVRAARGFSRGEKTKAKAQSATFWTAWLRLFAALFMLALFAVAAVAEDEVVEHMGPGREPKVSRGQILDYDGRTLTLRVIGGREKTILSKNVIEIRAKFSEELVAAEELYQANDYAGALRSLASAGRAEKQPWVQRRILARLCRCYHNTGEAETACLAFMRLIQNDPNTIHYGDIPLNWTTEQTPAAMEAKAETWMNSPETAVQALLGASWLFSIATKRTAAMNTLRALTSNPDERISTLAAAQLWRASWPTIDAAEADRWETQIKAMPPELRSGPYFVLGRARARLGDKEAAALALLRAPVLHPDQQALASDALRIAARELEQLDQRREAASLYREIIKQYKSSSAAAEAQTRLNLLENE